MVALPVRDVLQPPDRRFEAIVFDWDGTAVPDRRADAGALRARMAELSDRGVHLVVVSGTHLGNVDGQLRFRPDGPGTVHLCLNRGSEVYALDRRGPRLVHRREATPAEDAALDRAAAALVARLAGHGLSAEIVSARLNRRKIDLIPDPAWTDPPKARIAELARAVEARLGAAGVGSLGAVVAMAEEEAVHAGLDDARVTSDAKHVEIGLTDKSDSATWAFADLWRRGIGPGLVLVAGDEFGPLGGAPGSDALLLPDGAARAWAVSVGVEPGGAPAGVIHLGGGPDAFLALLDDQLERRARRAAPDLDDDPRWTVTPEHDHRLQRVHEALTALSNGTVGVRGAREEDGPGTEPLLLAQGVYTDPKRQRLLHGPDWTALVVPPAPRSKERLRLDLRTGVLCRERQEGSGPALRTVRFVSLPCPTACGLRAEGPASRLAGGEGLRAPEGDAPYEEGQADGAVFARVRSVLGGGITVAVEETEAVHDGRRCVERLAAVLPGADRVAGKDAVVRELRSLSERGFDALLAEHRQAWADLWEDAAVDIEGDPEAELAVRLALFHVLAAAPASGEAAVGARGLTGSAYGGHVFWDADVFVLPVLAAVRPAAARAILEYRVRRLPAAQRLAAARGWRGARFAWESAHDGDDVTPTFVHGPRGEVVAIRTGQREDHISADVAWAASEYAAWSGDEEFLRGPGRALLTETARFWASRARWDGEGRAHVYGVIGPDEYHEVVDDNAYTNVLARWNLRRAAELVEADGEGATREEAAAWRRLAGALVDGYDPATGRHEQFAGFSRLEPLIIEDVAMPPLAADLLLGRRRVGGAQVVKQADVVMLHHLVPDELPAGSLPADLDYYLPRTAHGSSLSPAIHAAVLARAGRAEEALTLFRLACRLDLDDITGTTAGGVHLAAMAGVWHAVAYGFLGLRVRGDTLVVDPALPEPWRRLTVRLRHRGARVRVEASHDEVVVEADRPVHVAVGAGAPRGVTTARIPLHPRRRP